MAIEVKISDEIYNLIKDNASDYYTMQIIVFFGNHPFARFNELAVIHALNQENGRHLIQKSLRDLVNAGIIKAEIEGRAAVFSVVENMREIVTGLAGLDIHQQQQFLKSALAIKRDATPAAQVFSVLTNNTGKSSRDAARTRTEVQAAKAYTVLTGAK
jgi:hypothetical protein